MTNYDTKLDSDLLAAYEKRWQEDNSSIVFFPLAEAYRKTGQTEQAIRLCQIGLDKHPNYMGARVVLARALLERKQTEEAKSELETVVQNIPYNLLASKLLAKIYIQEGELAKAVSRYRIIAGFYPEDREISKQINYILQTEIPRKKRLLEVLEQWRDSIRESSCSNSESDT